MTWKMRLFILLIIGVAFMTMTGHADAATETAVFGVY